MDCAYVLGRRLDGEGKAVRVCWKFAGLASVMLVHGALAQDRPMELTPAGKANLQATIAQDGRPLLGRSGPSQPMTFPLATCMFPGGLCGAVHRDGTVAVFPRYDWVGTFSDHRAAVRIGGLYGIIDEDGREIVRPQYRIVDDYKFGFAQVDVDGKSGLIDEDGRMVVEPKYGFIRAIGPDRFAVSEDRRLGGMPGGEDFSNSRIGFGGLSDAIFEPMLTDVIDIQGRLIESRKLPIPWFDKDDPSLRWVQKEKLWGLARADGSWLVEPKFQQVDALKNGLARVTLNGKIGFIDRTGSFAIEPVFDKAWWFVPGFDRTSAERDGSFGVIDKSGTWIFQTHYQQIHFAINYDHPATVFGWHFRTADRWGLLDLDGHVVIGAEFDQPIQQCADGRLDAYKNKEWLYFKADGSPLQPPDGRIIDASCGAPPPYVLKIGDKFRLVDADSSPVTPVLYDAIFGAGRDVKNAKLDGKWGRLGPDGRWVLEPKFDYLSTGTDLFVASIDGKRGFMRSDGSWLIASKFDAAALRRDNATAFVTLAGATGVLRLADQSWAIPPRPGVLCDVSISHVIMSEAAGKRAILSQTGETWIDVGAERVGANLDFGLVTFLRNGKWGLVDTAGQVMVEPQYDEPVYFMPRQRGVAWAKHDGRWCAIDRHGHPVPGIACADTNPLGRDDRFACKVER
ncbi:WG repeat-containing protein [Bradyrhizobium sp. 2S1]|uniref:WG repeat-containing protein n=1 Tax=Bradyrhizobium sp. 2S1 TaxID=1404429 RepID=UPI00140B99A1|nr:WG repeat-containing protein [Bradyrhizobium sp. 2S1]MCK7673231.1 WG repeat-containing protein [Bradyrhizobium sp. 2S1]